MAKCVACKKREEVQLKRCKVCYNRLMRVSAKAVRHMEAALASLYGHRS